VLDIVALLTREAGALPALRYAPTSDFLALPGSFVKGKDRRGRGLSETGEGGCLNL